MASLPCNSDILDLTSAEFCLKGNGNDVSLVMHTFESNKNRNNVRISKLLSWLDSSKETSKDQIFNF